MKIFLIEITNFQECKPIKNVIINFQLKELYMLLNENYVEDDDNMFRFDYSPEFLRWALLPPGFLQEWHVGVRAKKSKKMVGFISAVPATISIYKKVCTLSIQLK